MAKDANIGRMARKDSEEVALQIKISPKLREEIDIARAKLRQSTKRFITEAIRKHLHGDQAPDVGPWADLGADDKDRIEEVCKLLRIAQETYKTIFDGAVAMLIKESRKKSAG